MARKTHPYSSTSSSDEESSYNKGRGTGTGTTTTTYSGPTISDPTRRWLEVRSAEGEMAEGVTPEALDNLMWWNRGLGALHFIQAVLLYAFGYGFTITITRSFPDGPPGSAVPPAKRLFDMDIGGMVGSFLLFAAVDHALVGTVARKWYESDLANGICRARWLEYSWSASLMMVLIASYSGITSFVALINIAAANSAMILFGWLMEASNPPGRETTTWLPFAFGCLAGIFPWIAVWFQVFGASDEIPGFVYGIILSEMFAFACFGLTQLFQYLRLSIWSNYVKGEKTYLILSLVAKSILAWQIYGGSLSDDEDQ